MAEEDVDPSKAASPFVVNLSIWESDGEYLARYNVYENGDLGAFSPFEIPLTFGPANLKSKLETMESILSKMSKKGIWSKRNDPIGIPETEAVQASYEEFMNAVVSEGWSLFDQLSTVPDFADFLRMVDALPDGTKLTIETDSGLIPWEIIYPLPFNVKTPLKNQPKIELERIWGYRFSIGYLLLPKKGRKWQSRVNEHRSARAFVSMNLNHTIEKEFEKRPYKPIKQHEDYYNSQLGKDLGELIMNGEKIKEAVLSDSKATIIYLYCHGKSEDGKSWEELLVDKDASIEPATLAAGLNKYQSGPIVILNSCSSGAYSPLSFSSFYSEFMAKNAMGVLGTTLPMPATFAAAFALKLIDNYVNYKSTPVTIGNVMWALRQELIKKKNPLCLFYTLQCPMNATALKPAKEI